MNAIFTYRLSKVSIAASIGLLSMTTFAVLAQSTPVTPSTQSPAATQAKPTAAPAKPVAAPAVTPVQPNPAQTRAVAPVQNTQPQEPANGQVGNNPLNVNTSIPNSQFQNNQNAGSSGQPGYGIPKNAGYNNSGGIVNSTSMEGEALNHVHYHYHYTSDGQPIGNTIAGYAQQTYQNPAKLAPSAASMNAMNNNSNSSSGGMYTYANNNINPNSRVGPGSGGGVPTTWNPFLNNGAGMLTYGGASGVQGFND